MKIYIAGRYGRRLEFVKYAEKLKAAGHEVTSAWLDGVHEAFDGQPDHRDMACWSLEDLDNIDRSEAMVIFTEVPCAAVSRGGRHVELGYALSKPHPYEILVVGPCENIFYGMPNNKHFESIAHVLDYLGSRER